MIGFSDDLLRRRLFLAVATIVPLIAAALLVQATRAPIPRTESTESASTFEDGSRPVDTSPFVLDNLSSPNANSTIPGDLDEDRFADAPPTTASTTTTTTTKPEVAVAASDKPCLAAKQIGEMFRETSVLDSPPSELARYIAGNFRQAANYLRESGDPQYEPTIAVLDQASLELSSATDQAHIDDAVAPILTSTGPVTSGPTAALILYARSSCAGLLP